MTNPALTNVRPRRRKGFILPFALTVTTVSAITAVMLISYFNSFSRNARRAGARTRCRLAAQSVIEQTKIAIQNRFAVEAPPLMRTDPMMVSVFCDWFSTLSNASPSNTVFAAQAGLSEGGRTINSPVKMDDCIVYVGILPSSATTNATQAILPITATAELTLPDKQRVSVTLMEQVRFYAGQNQVFNYAYFANNYGWMNANGGTSDAFFINGDFRANGNISINGSTVNGFIYASANQNIGPLGADGNPSGVWGTADVSAHHWSASSYRRFAKDSMATMRPTDPIQDNGDSWLGGYDAPKGISGTDNKTKASTRSGTAGSPLISEKTDPIEMPMIAELDGYVKYAKQQNGTLKCPAYTYTDSVGTPHSIQEKNVNAHYDGVGPSESSTLADKGALVLIGTDRDPIVINGPIVVDSDVIIKGTIQGQGVIYSGRNIHVIGDVTYKNGPSWANVHSGASNAAKAVEDTKGKDLVCFIAKGNVVLGNCTAKDWLSSIYDYITPGSDYNTSQHDCDPSDASIGYAGRFDGNYTHQEAVGDKAKVRTGSEYRDVQTTSGYWQNNRWVETTKTEKKWVNVLKTKNDRAYYETVCDDAIINKLSSTINTLCGVFYNNHCVMGKMGDNKSKVSIFGSLVCRNEAIETSTNGGMYFNWDNRLREGSPAHVAGLPLPLGLQTPHTYSWQEVPDEMNPVYQGQKSALDAL